MRGIQAAVPRDGDEGARGATVQQVEGADRTIVRHRAFARPDHAGYRSEQDARFGEVSICTPPGIRTRAPADVPAG